MPSLRAASTRPWPARMPLSPSSSSGLVNPYNASARAPGPIAEIDPEAVRKTGGAHPDANLPPDGVHSGRRSQFRRRADFGGQRAGAALGHRGVSGAHEQIELPAAGWSIHHRTPPSSCLKTTRIGARH